MVDIYIGKNTGPLLLDFLKNARRRLIVVSPWISPACAEFALQKQREGVATAIITTNNENKEHQLALSKLLKKKRGRVKPHRWWLLIPGLALIFGGLYALFCVQVLPTDLLLPAALIALGAFLSGAGRGKTEKYLASLIETLIVDLETDYPLHAKVYVADDSAAVGSVNFTVSGLNRNIESFIIAGAGDDAVRKIEEMLQQRRVAVFKKEE